MEQQDRLRGLITATKLAIHRHYAGPGSSHGVSSAIRRKGSRRPCVHCQRSSSVITVCSVRLYVSGLPAADCRACHQGHPAVAKQAMRERLDTDSSTERLSRRSRTIPWGTVQQVSAFGLGAGSVRGSLHNAAAEEAWLRSGRRDLLQADIEFVSSV